MNLQEPRVLETWKLVKPNENAKLRGHLERRLGYVIFYAKRALIMRSRGDAERYTRKWMQCSTNN